MSGLSSQRILFGVHSVSPYSRANRMPYGIMKVLDACDVTLNSTVEQLYGGASKFAWAAETKTINSEISTKVSAYPGFLFTQWLGASVTDNAAETLGSVNTMTNFKGTSMVATTGMAQPTVKSGSEAKVAFGKYVVICVTITTVDVYMYSDVDIAKTGGAYQSDLLKITATPLTITASTAVDIPNSGLQLNGGSGTIGMTVGDTATFSSRPENSTSTDIIIGKNATTFPAFGMVMVAQKRATNEMFEIEAFNVIAAGMPIPMNAMAFSKVDLKTTCLYDSVQDAVMVARFVSALA